MNIIEEKINTPAWFVWKYIEMLRHKKVAFRGVELKNKFTKQVVVNLILDKRWVEFTLVAGRRDVKVCVYALTSKTRFTPSVYTDFFTEEESHLPICEINRPYLKLKYYWFDAPFVYVSEDGEEYDKQF